MSTPEIIKCPECDHWTSTGAGGVYECLRCGHIVDRRRCLDTQPAVTPGITTERDVRNTVTPAPAQGDTPRMNAFLNGRLPCSTLESELIEQGIRLERELAESKAAAAGFLSDAQKAWAEGDTLRQQLAAVTQERDEALEARQDWKLIADKRNDELAAKGVEYGERMERLRTRLTAAESELAALRQDRERLDWIQSRKFTDIQIGEGVCVIVGTAYQFNNNLRAAIDSARNQQEGRE